MWGLTDLIGKKIQLIPQSQACLEGKRWMISPCPYLSPWDFH